MKAYVLDADVVLAFLEDKPGASTLEDLLWKATQTQRPLHMSVISWSSLLCGIGQSKGEQTVREKIKQLGQLPLELIEVDAAAAESAASICAAHNIPLIDCFAIAAARQHRATLLTTNKKFLKLGDQLKVQIAI